jgi:hypothetical protein
VLAMQLSDIGMNLIFSKPFNTCKDMEEPGGEQVFY